MAVSVISSDDRQHEYPDAARWHTDGEGHLHVMAGGGGNLASYAPGAWRSVARVTVTTAEADAIRDAFTRAAERGSARR